MVIFVYFVKNFRKKPNLKSSLPGPDPVPFFFFFSREVDPGPN
jgi:hypothetical protein